MAMTLVSTVTVGSGGASSIEWTSIAQTGKDLLIVISARNSGGNGMYMTLNSDTSSTRTVRYLEGTGSTTSSGTITGQTGLGAYVGEPQSSTTTANTFGNSQIYISNYAGTTNKSFSVDVVNENNATQAFMYLIAGGYSITSGITSILLRYAGTNTFVQHSTASLYIIS